MTLAVMLLGDPDSQLPIKGGITPAQPANMHDVSTLFNRRLFEA